MSIKDIRLGTDIVNIERLRRGFNRFGIPFFQRLLTDDELVYCVQKGISHVQHENFLKRVAGRIAVKEAVSKALGVGVTGLGYSEGISWHSVELLSKAQQAPELQLNGKALAYANALNISEWRVSISHDGENAVATALGLVS